MFCNYYFTISLQLVAIYTKYLPSWLVFTSLLRVTFATLQKPCQGNFGKFQGSDESRFDGSLKIVTFWFSAETFMDTIFSLQRQQPIRFHCAKTLISLCTDETTQTTIFSIETQMFKVFWQPIQPVFCNNIKRFTTLFVQIFRLRAYNYV